MGGLLGVGRFLDSWRECAQATVRALDELPELPSSLTSLILHRPAIPSLPGCRGQLTLQLEVGCRVRAHNLLDHVVRCVAAFCGI